MNDARRTLERNISFGRIALVVSLAAYAIVALLHVAFMATARADSGITNDPTKLEYVLTERVMTVTAVNPDPVYGCSCHPPTRMGDRCTLPKGVGLWLKSVDKKHVLLVYPAWTEHAGGTCMPGTMVLMTRKEFAQRSRQDPVATRRMTAETLLSIVERLLAAGRAWP